jgi:hypothetical protein
MERVRATMPLEIRGEEAERLLIDYFQAYRTDTGAIEVPLRVPLEDFGSPDQLSLVHKATVTVHKARDEENLNDVFAITWRPKDGAPLPMMHGRMIVCSGNDGEPAYLELDGFYEPPLGAFGEVFEALLGHLVAQRTAVAFLSDVAAGLTSISKLRTGV